MTSLLSQTTIAIFGLGLMGGSLALGLHGKCARIIGVDPDSETCHLAQAHNVTDLASTTPTGFVDQAGLVILAAPVRGILTLIEQLPRLHPGSPVVLDLGSTKMEICHALENLPDRFDPIGGHPMCGKETSGLANADPAIFQGAAFALTPLSRTREHARTLAREVAIALGAHPIWLDAATHDEWVAHTSHLPYLLAAALAHATPEETAPLTGSGFRSTARLAGSSPHMMSDVLMTNRAPILRALARFRTSLDQLETQLRDNDPSLKTTLTEAQIRRQLFEKVKSTS
ncbi:MAG TPA: prephenate dehydrogenase/arogenate dehydrogenase family protein [Anaerolineales bacterium]|nr:prephenate dehydrogenase/arogenate dehydrogenase family protein [Anaerolineales bacterium]